MTLQYFEALKTMGASASTKFIFPLEFTGLICDFLKSRRVVMRGAAMAD